MIECIGAKNGLLRGLQIKGTCPHCGVVSRFSLLTPVSHELYAEGRPPKIIVGYLCDACHQAIPVEWTSGDWAGNGGPFVKDPKNILRSIEKFDFDHLPQPVRKEVEEALNCLSVDAFNGFAANVRRAVQAVCTSLGAAGTTKVQAQIQEVHDKGMLDDEQLELAKVIMLSGHDGAHPHLPDMDEDRARLLLELLKDMTYQLFTRPGKIEAAKRLRVEAAERKKGAP